MTQGIRVWAPNGAILLSATDRTPMFVATYFGSTAVGASTTITVPGWVNNGMWDVVILPTANHELTPWVVTKLASGFRLTNHYDWVLPAMTWVAVVIRY